MSTDGPIDRQVNELFNRHCRSDHTLDDVSAFNTLLPNDKTVLRALATRCVEEGRKAMHAGRHMEGRRLDILGRQLHRLADAEAL